MEKKKIGEDKKKRLLINLICTRKHKLADSQMLLKNILLVSYLKYHPLYKLF